MAAESQSFDPFHQKFLGDFDRIDHAFKSSTTILPGSIKSLLICSREGILNMFLKVGLAAITIMLTATDAISQTAEPSRASLAETGECELHIWPAAGLHAMFFGWVHGSTLDGSSKNREGYPLLPTDPLPPRTQLETIAAMGPAGLPDVPANKLVLHKEPLDPQARAAQTRHAESRSPCYSELIVDDIFYEDAVGATHSLRTLFRFRDFGGASEPRTAFTTWAATPLLSFPPKDPQNSDVALAEIRNALGEDLRKFALYLAKFKQKASPKIHQ